MFAITGDRQELLSYNAGDHTFRLIGITAVEDTRLILPGHKFLYVKIKISLLYIVPNIPFITQHFYPPAPSTDIRFTDQRKLQSRFYQLLQNDIPISGNGKESGGWMVLRWNDGNDVFFGFA